MSVHERRQLVDVAGQLEVVGRHRQTRSGLRVTVVGRWL